MPTEVGVVGGAGHVGFGLCLILASKGHKVHGIDTDAEANRKIMAGEVPFHEEGAEPLLRMALEEGRLQMTGDISVADRCDVVCVVIGTPIDENLNPVLDPLLAVCRDLAGCIRKNQLIILRSTVSPGTTRQVKRYLEDTSGKKESEDFYLVFAPERVAQGQALKEIVALPQLIGAFSDAGYKRAEGFFQSFIENRCFQLKPEEAEIGKLITNMTRYVTFALVNEYYCLADLWDVNIHRVIDACNFDYPRLNLPNPGPNVGGPCLYKDGFFLIESVPFPELIATAFTINEGMTSQIVSKIQGHKNVRKVGILGMAFKGNSDDTRNSLSYKLRKQLRNRGYETAEYDPWVKEFKDPACLRDCDCLVLMTPHSKFKELDRVRSLVDSEDCLAIDIWGFWDEMRGRSRNGVFSLKAVRT